MSSNALWRNATQKARAFGQSLTEYGLVMGLVSIVSIGTLSVLGGQIEQSIQDINGSFSMNGSLALTGAPTTAGTTGQTGQTGQTGLINTSGNTTVTTGGQTSGMISLGGPGSGGGATAGTGSGGIPSNGTTTSVNGNTSALLPDISGSGGALAVDQTLSPQYQSWLAANPQTANMIKQLSSQGQKIANEAYAEAVAKGTPPDSIPNYLMANLSPADKILFQQSLNSVAQSLGE